MPTPTISPSAALGPNIRRNRELAGLTQLALAHKIGLHGEDAGAAVSRWESGVQEPRLDAITRIAGALGVGLDDLLTGGK